VGFLADETTKNQVSLPVHLFSPVSMILPILYTRIILICHWYHIALAVESVVKQTLNRLKCYSISTTHTNVLVLLI
jgi:hypothetical protein